VVADGGGRGRRSQRRTCSKWLREKRGTTQEALAFEPGVTTGTLSLIERGQSNPPWDA